MTRQLFVAIRTHGPAWLESKPLESQPAWTLHASFMDALVEEGFIVLGGPLQGTADALLVIRATTADEVRSRLGQDPWIVQGVLRDTRIAPWTLRLGALE